MRQGSQTGDKNDPKTRFWVFVITLYHFMPPQQRQGSDSLLW
jgi:hypothetical protein